MHFMRIFEEIHGKGQVLMLKGQNVMEGSCNTAVKRKKSPAKFIKDHRCS